MSGNQNGGGKDGQSGDLDGAQRLDGRRTDGLQALPPGTMTPEQGCLTCSGGVGMILLALAFWAYIYWRNEPTLHPPAPPAVVATPTPNASDEKPGFAPRIEKK